MKPPIKLVILDFHGVISTGSYWDIAREISRRNHLKVAEVYNVIYSYHNQAAVGEIPERQVFSRTVKQLGIPDNPRELADRHIILTSIPNQSVLKYAVSLRRRGIGVIGLSKNIPFVHRENVRRSRALKYVDAVINTYDLGLPKASKETITTVLKQFGIKDPKSVILVDDQADNLATAGKMGIQTHLYKNFKEMRRLIARWC